MLTLASLAAASLLAQLTQKLRRGFEGLVYGPFFPGEPPRQMRLALSSNPHITVEISMDTLEMIDAISQKPRAADTIIQDNVNLIVQPRFSEDMHHILTYFINKQIQESQTGMLAARTYWRELMLCAAVVGRAFVALCEPRPAFRPHNVGYTFRNVPNEIEFMILNYYSEQRKARLTGMSAMIEKIISPAVSSSLDIETSTSQYKTDVPRAFCVLVLFLTSFRAISSMENALRRLNLPIVRCLYVHMETYLNIWVDLPDFFETVFKGQDVMFLSPGKQDLNLTELIEFCKQTNWYLQRPDALRTRFRPFVFKDRPFHGKQDSILVDKDRNRCHLCRSKFMSLNHLLRHERHSNLHIQNLRNEPVRAAALRGLTLAPL
jgi:hypothetical protein